FVANTFVPLETFPSVLRHFAEWNPVSSVVQAARNLFGNSFGALAIGTGRASRRGFVLDSAVDRLTEAAYASALWAAGAPGWLAVVFGALCWLPDYLRARAGQAGVAETGALSVWERPTRVIMTGLTLVGAGVLAGAAELLVTVGTAAGALLGVVAVTQLGVSLRRMLAD
ncbi:hypothetical protein, partial [Blastococcus sp. CT_GayMR16]|uniref:hypothetical protein n=1 Tax=Blastococcus sp. CT_GayMR16 TaxID=2559607 RepID=UPI001FD7DFF9